MLGLFKTPGFDNKYEVLDSIAYVIGKPSLRSDAHKGKSKSGCLRRSFNAKPMGISVVKKALLHSARSFSIFEAIIRVSLHNSIHNDIGALITNLDFSIMIIIIIIIIIKIIILKTWLF